MFESRLDGELVILAELDRPIRAIGLVRNAVERERLFAALAYQGFAADRYFGDQLGADPRAEAHRVVLEDGTAVPRAWAWAVALDPERVPTPYEIAEAPQRVRYNELRERIRARLPGLIVVDEALPAGAEVVLDGAPLRLEGAPQVRALPGRHHAHIQQGGHVLARFDLMIEPGSTSSLQLALSEAVYADWLTAIADGGSPPVPEILWPSIRALGGEVVMAAHDERDRVRAASLTVNGVEPIVLDGPRGDKPDQAWQTRVEAGVGVGGGWFSSGDFYLQDPGNAPRDKGTVNAGAIDAAVDVRVAVGVLCAGVVLDVAVPVGEHHVAFTGDGQMRARPEIAAAVGVRWAQVTAGYLFPYHPSVGARLTIPVGAGVELLATGAAGLPTTRERADGSTWTGEPVWRAWAGVGWRFSSGR
jgi:hypothetical protein